MASTFNYACLDCPLCGETLQVLPPFHWSRDRVREAVGELFLEHAAARHGLLRDQALQQLIEAGQRPVDPT